MVTLLISGYEGIESIGENFKTKVCSQIPENPYTVPYTAKGSSWKDGKISICGGHDNIDKVWIGRSECYFIVNGEWKFSGNLQTGRRAFGVSNIGNSIWITGGLGDAPEFPKVNSALASTEIIHSDGKITPGPNLPEARNSHCQISYEQSTFIIGMCISLPIL